MVFEDIVQEWVTKQSGSGCINHDVTEGSMSTRGAQRVPIEGIIVLRSESVIQQKCPVMKSLIMANTNKSAGRQLQ